MEEMTLIILNLIYIFKKQYKTKIQSFHKQGNYTLLQFDTFQSLERSLSLITVPYFQWGIDCNQENHCFLDFY